jgi:hypothetical protein
MTDGGMLAIFPCPWGMCMVIPIDMGSKINLRRTSAYAVSGAMLMCSRHEDWCTVWRMHKHHVHVYTCMFVWHGSAVHCVHLRLMSGPAEACHVQIVSYQWMDLIVQLDKVCCDAMCVLVSC